MSAKSWLIRTWLGSAVVLSVVFSIPLVLLVGHKEPSWVSDAWVVSGVPITLILSLLVFLLATAAGQNLRATASYRAIISRTYLIWPVAWSVVFLVWCGVIERFSNDSATPPSGFANTWLLLLFGVQVLFVLLVFARLLALIAPAQVMEMVQQTFAENVRASIAERLRRKLALQALHDACAKAGMKLAVMGSGQLVSAGREGWIDDVDLALPATVTGFNATAETTLTVLLGTRSTSETAIARINGEVGDWLPRVLRQGVRVRRRPRASTEPAEIFGEVLDLARRAVGERIPTAIQASFDLIGACMGELPAAYRIFGLQYTEEATSEGPILRSDEQRISDDLDRFSRDVVTSPSQAAQRALPGLALKMALAGVREDAPLLLQQGLALWQGQLALADAYGAEDLYKAYVADIPSLARSVIQTLQRRLEDASLTLERRLTAVPLLQRVFTFYTRLLKHNADKGAVTAFRDTWTELATWAEHWHPENDVDDLEFELSVAQDGRERHRLERSLDLARKVADAKAELDGARNWNMLNLGAWMLLRYRAGELDRATWEQLLSYVSGVFGSFNALVTAMEQLSHDDGRTRLLRDWDLNSQLARVRPGTAVGSRSRETEVLWVTLLLMRQTPAGRAPHLTLGGQMADAVGGGVLSAIATVAADPEQWDVVVGGDPAAKAAKLKAAVQAAVATARAAAAAQAAAAPIVEERVAHFVAQQDRSFALANRVRELVGRAGSVDIEVSAEAFGDPGFGDTLDKRFFIDDGLNPPPLDFSEYGRELAAVEQMAAYKKLVELAAPAPQAIDPASSILAAVAELRADGFEPDAILAPSGRAAWSAITGHPEFKRAPRLREHPSEIGALSGIPVLTVGPEDANGIVVAQLGRAIRLIERRRPGMASSLLCDVRPIDDARALQFIAAARAKGQTATDADAARLRDGAVEVIARLDYDVLAGPAGSQAARMAHLPPV